MTKTEGLIETHATKIGSVTSKSDSNELMWKERPTTGAVFLMVVAVVGVVGTVVGLAVNAGKIGEPDQIRDQRGADTEAIDSAGGASPAPTASATRLPLEEASAAP